MKQKEFWEILTIAAFLIAMGASNLIENAIQATLPPEANIAMIVMGVLLLIYLHKK